MGWDGGEGGPERKDWSKLLYTLSLHCCPAAPLLSAHLDNLVCYYCNCDVVMRSSRPCHHLIDPSIHPISVEGG